MKKILIIYNAAIAAILSLFGCTVNGPDEYGTPSADFVINGKVSSNTGQPVPEIAVTMRTEHYTDTAGNRLFSTIDSVATNSHGEYQIVAQSLWPEDHTFHVVFSDVDGAANGSFADTTITVEFVDPAFSGGSGNWYAGQVQKELNVELSPKE
ncbi:MAG: radical SAM-associated putative lipoprotein [Prevotellaceae bacterium]|nr:radical SAM-associated putative lipoprotein [Prevotellaceae bacterium]